MSALTEIERIKEGKTGIANSIQNKGVAVPASAKIDDLPPLIDEIGTVIQLETLKIAPMSNAEINANLVAGAFVKVANNFVIMSDLANGATVNNTAIPSSSFYYLFEGVISTQQMQFISVLPVAVGKDLDGIVFNESGTYVLAQMCQSGVEITIPNFRFIKTLEVVERGATTITSRRNTSNNTIVFTAENNQSAGYTAGGKSTATKTVSLSASGKTVTATDGTTSISQDVTTGSAKTPATTITKTPTISVNSSGVIAASVSGTQSVTPTVTAGYVSSGTAGTITVSGSTTKNATDLDANLKAKNIKAGERIFGVTGSYAPNMQNKGVHPSKEAQVISPDDGYDGLSNVVVSGDDNLVESNIKNGVSIFGVTGSYAPKLQSKTVSPSTSAQTVKPDSSYDGLSQVTVNAVATATQATPSISVSSAGLITASATQSAGYVSAGTKSATKQLTIQAAKTVTPTTSEQTAVASGRYTTGAVKVAAIPTVTRAQTSLDIALDADVPNQINVKATNNQTTGYVVADANKNVASAELYLEAEGDKVILRDSDGAIAEVTVSGGGANISTGTVQINLDEAPYESSVTVHLIRLINGAIVHTYETVSECDIVYFDNVVVGSPIIIRTYACCFMEDYTYIDNYWDEYFFTATGTDYFHFWD